MPGYSMPGQLHALAARGAKTWCLHRALTPLGLGARPLRTSRAFERCNIVHAAYSSSEGNRNGLRGGLRGGLDPSLESEVPEEQRPVNELAQLKKTNLLDWAVLDTPGYAKRLFTVFGGFFAVLGGPIAYQTFDPMSQTWEFVLSGVLGALLVVALAVLRIYLGWAYVGNRLLSAAVDYEETGWYDGQVFVKPPEVLARDRLLGSYEVRPTLERLKRTLIGSGLALTLTGLTLFGLVNSTSDQDGMYGRGASRKGPTPREINSNGLIYSDKVKNLADLRDDDDAAAAEAAAQGGVPGYCGDRYFRAAAGGQYCAKFDKR